MSRPTSDVSCYRCWRQAQMYAEYRRRPARSSAETAPVQFKIPFCAWCIRLTDLWVKMNADVEL